MSPQHDSHQRSGHGQFIRSPHGQHRDIRTTHDPSHHLLLVQFIDESIYQPGSVGDEMPYVGVQGADPAPGKARYDDDYLQWLGLCESHQAIGLIVKVEPRPDDPLGYLYALTPEGRPWPGDYIALTNVDRPVSSVDDGYIQTGLSQALQKFWDQYGNAADVRQVIYIVDSSGSMVDWSNNSAAVLGSITTELQSRGVMNPEAGEAWTITTSAERWLRAFTDMAKIFYGIP